MNGAVQGEAMAVASTPVKNASTVGLRACQLATLLGKTLPNSNKPTKFKPIRVKSTASAATTAGLWSWKPQPSCSPAARKLSKSAPKATKDNTTPAV